MAASDLLKRWLPNIHRGRALDIGAGEGDVTIWLARGGFKVDAIERDPGMCVRLKEIGEGLDINVHAVDVMDYDFAQELYSFIYAGAILHFLKPTDLWTLADRIADSLVPGGIFIAEVFTTDDPGYEELRSTGAEEIEPNTFLSPSLDDPIHYFIPGELARTFSSLQVQAYEEARYLDELDPVEYRSGATIVALKPGIRQSGSS